VRSTRGHFALIRTPRGFYLPGGGIEAGETPAQAIKREATEESGLILEARTLLGNAVEIVYSAEENVCFEKRCVFIEAEVLSQIPLHESDHDLIWVDLDQAISVLSHESHRWVLRRYARPGTSQEGHDSMASHSS